MYRDFRFTKTGIEGINTERKKKILDVEMEYRRALVALPSNMRKDAIVIFQEAARRKT